MAILPAVEPALIGRELLDDPLGLKLLDSLLTEEGIWQRHCLTQPIFRPQLEDISHSHGCCHGAISGDECCHQCPTAPFQNELLCGGSNDALCWRVLDFSMSAGTWSLFLCDGEILSLMTMTSGEEAKSWACAWTCWGWGMQKGNFLDKCSKWSVCCVFKFQTVMLPLKICYIRTFRLQSYSIFAYVERNKFQT